MFLKHTTLLLVIAFIGCRSVRFSQGNYDYTLNDSFAVGWKIIDFSATPDHGVVYLREISPSNFDFDCKDTSLSYSQKIHRREKISSPNTFLLIKMDKNGRKMWNKCLCDEAIFYDNPEKWCSSIPNTVGRIISTNDNGFLVSLYGAILKLDSVGNPQWTFSFCKDSIPGISKDLLKSFSYPMVITDIKQCANGDYVALISQSFSILLLSKDGTPKWLKPTLPGAFGTKYFYLFKGGINSGAHLIDSLSLNAYEAAPFNCEVHPVSDGGFIASGHFPFPENSYRLLLKNDPEYKKYKFFDPVSKKQIFPASVIAIETMKDNIIKGLSDGYAANAYRIIKVNKDGQLEWEKLSGRFEKVCYRMGLDKEDNILFASGILFFKYNNKDGDTLSARKHPEGVTWIGSVTANSDNGYWAFGESYGPPFVAKLNQEGDIIWYKTIQIFPPIDVKDAGDGGCLIGNHRVVLKMDSKGNLVQLRDLKERN